MTRPLVGLWIDDAPRLVASDAYLDALADLGLHTVAIMLEDVTDGRRVWTRDQVRGVVPDLVDADLDVVLTSCPTPSRGAIDQLLPWLESMADCGVAGLELDLESRWRGSRCEGFASLLEASDYLVAGLGELARRHDLRLEVTTHPQHGEQSDRATVTDDVDRLNSQAYSVRRRPGKLVEWTDRLGPGRCQRWAARDALDVPGVADGRPQLGLGLPAWSQTWPGRRPQEAMQAAWDAAVAACVVEVRYWSSKYVIGRVGTAWARSFISELYT